MKRFIFLFILFFSTYASCDFFDISLETKGNQKFETYLFEDINTTQKLEKQLTYTNLNLHGNYNDIVGFQYSKNNLISPNKIDFKEIYIGSGKTKFLGYATEKTTIRYGNRIQKTDSVKYTFYDLLTYEKSDLSSNAIEDFTPNAPTDMNITTSDVTRSFTFEKVSVSSENLYEHIKENTIDGENYFYGVAIAQNFTPWLRVYGVAIASYEQHDYSDGKANYLDTNGTRSIFNEGVDDTNKMRPEDGKFKGFGYGYKLTAEAYWKNLSVFITNYYKKTKLKNYHSEVKYAEADAEPVSNLISEPELNFLQKYTSFGVRYRF